MKQASTDEFTPIFPTKPNSDVSPATLARYCKPKPFAGFVGRFPRAIFAVSEVSLFGTKKHNVPLMDMSYLCLPDGANEMREAKMRHVLNEAISGPIDVDFQLFHAAHEAWNAMARLEIMLKNQEEQEKQKEQEEQGEQK